MESSSVGKGMTSLTTVWLPNRFRRLFLRWCH